MIKDIFDKTIILIRMKVGNYSHKLKSGSNISTTSVGRNNIVHLNFELELPGSLEKRGNIMNYTYFLCPTEINVAFI